MLRAKAMGVAAPVGLESGAGWLVGMQQFSVDLARFATLLAEAVDAGFPQANGLALR